MLITGYKQAIVRIFNQSGTIIGTGIAISSKQILTCAHVVASSVGLPNAKAKTVNVDFFESDRIKIDFPTRKDAVTITKVSFYIYSKDNPAYDIAILEQDHGDVGSFPADLKPEKMLLPSSPDDSAEHVWEGQGYPKGAKNGLIAFGSITGQLATGLLQLDGTGTHTINVSPGFSGGGVFDRELEGVIGIFNLATNDNDKQTATAIPTAIIQAKLAEAGIELPVTSKTAEAKEPVNSDSELVMSKEQLKQLRQKMGDWLSSGNIRTACFDMGIDYGDIEGGTKTAKIESLVGYCRETGRLDELISVIKEINPYRDWEV